MSQHNINVYVSALVERDKQIRILAQSVLDLRAELLRLQAVVSEQDYQSIEAVLERVKERS